MFRSVGPMLIIGLVAVFPLAGSAAAQSSMLAQEIQASVIGNTITGAEDNERYAEYISPDGRILGRTESGSYSGNWRIEGNELCVSYGKKPWECTALRLTGNQLVWVDPDGGDVLTTLSKGNTEYLKFPAPPQKE